MKVMERPPIPRPLEREVFIEAGHRCAIPACRQTPVVIHHIVPWEKVQKHEFDNLIALCPNCHAKCHNGDIDRKAMLQYKTNISVVNGRYGDLEKRVLKYFGENKDKTDIWLPGELEILLMYLIKDGLLKSTQIKFSGPVKIKPWRPGGEYDNETQYILTEKGREFIERWLAPEELE